SMQRIRRPVGGRAPPFVVRPELWMPIGTSPNPSQHDTRPNFHRFPAYLPAVGCWTFGVLAPGIRLFVGERSWTRLRAHVGSRRTPRLDPPRGPRNSRPPATRASFSRPIGPPNPLCRLRGAALFAPFGEDGGLPRGLRLLPPGRALQDRC